MSDEAVKVYNYKTGNRVFDPDPSIGLSNAEICNLLALLELQVSPDIYDRMSPMLKRHFKETAPYIHPAFKQD